MESEKTEVWRWSGAEAIRRVDSVLLQDAIMMSDQLRSAIVETVRQAQTDAFHHGRRSVQRTIVSALDIQHMVKR